LVGTSATIKTMAQNRLPGHAGITERDNRIAARDGNGLISVQSR
jgi:hypothetical protein